MYEFGPFQLDPDGHRLLRDGRPVPLKPKAFDMLMLFVKSGRRVISKEELMGRLWPQAFVEEASLTQNIYELRKALGDDERELIENVPRRGYRFVPELRRSAGSAIRSLAVLPFRLLGRSPDSEYLELGVADALITALSSLSQVVIRPPSSVGQFAGRNTDTVMAGRALSADAVVDGTIQFSGDRLRVTSRLLDVSDGSLLWAGKFDEPSADLFTVSDAIAESIADALGRRITGHQQAALPRRHAPKGDAYRLYLSGRYNWNKSTEESLWKAIEFFRQAIAADPQYALAWVGIADAYTSLDWYGVLSTRQSNPQATAAAETALRIDPNLGEAHASLAMARQNAWHWQSAEAEYRRALELNPNYAHVWQWYGVFLTFIGRIEEGIEQMRRARDLDPVSLSIGSQMALVLMCGRRYEEAMSHVTDSLEIEPASVEARFYLGMLQTLKGDYAEAVRTYRMLPETNPDFLAMLGHALAAGGWNDEARATLGKLRALAAERYVSPFWEAMTHVGLGDHDQALRCLQRAVDDPDDSLLGLKTLPFLDPIRETGQYRALLLRMGLSES